jgi:hypothetical protein
LTEFAEKHFEDSNEAYPAAYESYCAQMEKYLKKTLRNVIETKQKRIDYEMQSLPVIVSLSLLLI